MAGLAVAGDHVDGVPVGHVGGDPGDGDDSEHGGQPDEPVAAQVRGPRGALGGLPLPLLGAHDGYMPGAPGASLPGALVRGRRSQRGASRLDPVAAAARAACPSTTCPELSHRAQGLRFTTSPSLVVVLASRRVPSTAAGTAPPRRP